MTAVTKKTKNRITYKKMNLSGGDAAMVLIWFFISAAAAKASWADVSLAGLTFVLTALHKDMLAKAASAAGAFVSLLILSVSDVIYIPYFMCCTVYTVLSAAIKKEKYPEIISLAVFVLSDILLVHFANSAAYKRMAVLQAFAMYLILQIVISGMELIRRKITGTFTDIITLSVTLMVIFLSLSGFDSRWIYTGRSAALSASWLYIRYGMYLHSFASLVCLFIVLMDINGFLYLFIISVAIWFAGAFIAEKQSRAIYPVVIVTAFAGNLLFISELSGFGFTGTVIMALLLYTVAPYITDIKRKELSPVFASGKDYRQLVQSVKKLENSLNYLGNCAVDISRLNEKNLPSIPLEDMVAEDVCKKCDGHSYCWQEKYSFTRNQLQQYAHRMNWQGENRFDPGFYVQCRHTDRLKASFDENSRLLISRKYMLQSQKNSQKLLQTTFLSVAAAVGDIISNSRGSQLVNATATMQMDRFLSSLEIPHTYCLCSRNPDKMSFAVHDPVAESDLYKIRRRLENIYDTRFDDPVADSQGTEIIYTFHCRTLYSYDCSILSSPYSNINGDCREIFTNGCKLFVLLSDGMGTGSAAAAESRTVLAMAKQLICTGISMDNVMNIVNLALNLKGSGETGATLDILRTDLFTGKATLTKAGAEVSFVINSNNLTRFYKDSLPLGVTKDVKISTDTFTLTPQDTVILASDGVGEISSNIRNMYSQPCDEITRYVINENRTMDDKTVVAIRLKPARI